MFKPDNHFRQFAASLERVICGYGDQESDQTAQQKRQVEDLVKLEDKFKSTLIKDRRGNGIYKSFMCHIMDERKNILAARPYFRERQDIFKQDIAPLLRNRYEVGLYKFNINYSFIAFALKNARFAPNSRVMRAARKVQVARQELIELNIPLAISRAKLFKQHTPQSHLEYMDLVQIANEGLIAAVDKFVLPYTPVFRAVIIGRISGNHIEEYCVDPKTRVLTSDLRWVSAESLAVNDSLIGFDEYGHSGCRKWMDSKVISTGVRELCKRRIITNNGTIVVSNEHLFLCVGGKGGEQGNSLRARPESPTRKGLGHRWVRADRLLPEDKIVFLGQPWEEGKSYEHGYLKGISDGEGTISPSGVISIAQNPGVVFDDIGAALKQLGFSPYENGPHKTNGVKVWCIGGIYKTMHFLGEVRPSRLLKKSKRLYLNKIIANKTKLGKTDGHVLVISNESIGNGPVITLQTSTGTLVTEGMLSHNSDTLLHFYPSDKRKIYRANKVQGIKGVLPFDDLAKEVNQGADAPHETTADELHQLLSASSHVSIDAPVTTDVGIGEVENSVDRYPADNASRPDVQVEEREAYRVLFKAIEGLSLIERKLIEMKGIHL